MLGSRLFDEWISLLFVVGELAGEMTQVHVQPLKVTQVEGMCTE